MYVIIADIYKKLLDHNLSQLLYNISHSYLSHEDVDIPYAMMIHPRTQSVGGAPMAVGWRGSSWVELQVTDIKMVINFYVGYIPEVVNAIVLTIIIYNSLC